MCVPYTHHCIFGENVSKHWAHVQCCSRRHDQCEFSMRHGVFLRFLTASCVTSHPKDTCTWIRDAVDSAVGISATLSKVPYLKQKSLGWREYAVDVRNSGENMFRNGWDRFGLQGPIDVYPAVDMDDRSVLFRPCRGDPVAPELESVSHEVPLNDAVVWRHLTLNCVTWWQMMTRKKQASTRVPMWTPAKPLRPVLTPSRPILWQVMPLSPCVTQLGPCPIPPADPKHFASYMEDAPSLGFLMCSSLPLFASCCEVSVFVWCIAFSHT